MPPSKKSDKRKIYISLPLSDFGAHTEPLPGPIYLFINQKVVCYRKKGEILDINGYNHLICKHVQFVFIEESDRRAFYAWSQYDLGFEKIDQADEKIRTIAGLVQNQRNTISTLFQAPRDQMVRLAIHSTKKMVAFFLQHPYTIDKVFLLQKYSQGLFDHSINVSFLSVFFGMRMGYADQTTLDNLAVGGLLHDIGKALFEDRKVDESHPAMKEHPRVGKQFLDEQKGITREARKIVMQHHEFLDGSGYPNQLKGLAIYDLARIVAIANVYDNLVSQSKVAKTKDRVSQAIECLENDYKEKLDPQKLQKVVHILRSSFV